MQRKREGGIFHPYLLPEALFPWEVGGRPRAVEVKLVMGLEPKRVWVVSLHKKHKV